MYKLFHKLHKLQLPEHQKYQTNQSKHSYGQRKDKRFVQIIINFVWRVFYEDGRDRYNRCLDIKVAVSVRGHLKM